MHKSHSHSGNNTPFVERSFDLHCFVSFPLPLSNGYFLIFPQLLFPVLMVIMVWRTISVRVRPNELLVYRLHGDTNGSEESSDNDKDTVGGHDGSRPLLMLAEDGRGVPSDAELINLGCRRHPNGLWQKVQRICKFKEQKLPIKLLWWRRRPCLNASKIKSKGDGRMAHYAIAKNTMN